MYIAKETDDGRDLTDVLISGTSFSHLVEKGMYFETLSDALITGITMNDVGQWGRGSAPVFHGGATGNIGGFGGGIDINLKWDHETTTDTIDGDAPYSGITIQNFTFTDVGSSDKDGGGPPHAGGAAIAVKARDDAPSYSDEAATFTGAVVIQNGTIDGTSTGIRAGEPGKNVADPARHDHQCDDHQCRARCQSRRRRQRHPVDDDGQSYVRGDTLDAHATATGDIVVNARQRRRHDLDRRRRRHDYRRVRQRHDQRPRRHRHGGGRGQSSGLLRQSRRDRHRSSPTSIPATATRAPIP